MGGDVDEGDFHPPTFSSLPLSYLPELSFWESMPMFMVWFRPRPVLTSPHAHSFPPIGPHRRVAC